MPREGMRQAPSVSGSAVPRVLARLQIPQGPEADLLRLADDQVVVQRDAKGAGGVLHLAGHRDVGLRRRRVAAGVVVDHPF